MQAEKTETDMADKDLGRESLTNAERQRYRQRYGPIKRQRQTHRQRDREEERKGNGYAGRQAGGWTHVVLLANDGG